jgi:hypothetical protein
VTQLDAFLLWLRHNVARFGQLVKLYTVPEAALAVGATSCLAVATGHALMTGGWSAWLVAVLVLAVLVMDALVVTDAVVMRTHHKRLGATMVKLSAAKPTGAPRTAEVVCRHGDPHRFVYGMTGWEPAGPAVEHRPIQEEVPHP